MYLELKSLDLWFWQEIKGFDKSEFPEILSIYHNKCKI
jgi:hypothetical protein